MSLSKITTPWSAFYDDYRKTNLSCICLIGTQNSGKSTLCELFMAFVANKKNSNLNFDDGKVKMYTMPGVISNNVLKIQTVKPVVYEIQAKVDNLPNSTIIDVPTYASPPFNESNKKLWSIADTKVTMKFLLNSISSCSLVLVIDQKFTRAPMDGTKSLLINFIETFSQHPKQLLDSTALIISKCPAAGFKLDTCITKIQKCIEKFEEPIKSISQAWFKDLVKRNGILTFNKFTNQQIAQDIKALYKGITKLTPYNINPKQIKSFSQMNNDIKQQIKKYLSGLQIGLEKLIVLIIEIIDSIINNQETYQAKKDTIVQLLAGGQTQKSFIKSQNAQLPSFFNIISACYAVSKICSGQVHGSIFLNILQEFVKYKIIQQQEELYNCLKQRADFFNFFWPNQQNIAGWNSQQTLKKLQEQAKDIKKNSKITQAIKDGFQQGASIDFYQNLIEMIEYFIPPKQLQTHQLSNVWINSSLQLAAKQQKAKSLRKFLQIQSKLKIWKKNELISNLLAKIAEVLIKADRVSFAVNLFSKCGNPYKGIQIMNQILKQKDIKKCYNVKDFVPYLQFLQNIGLFDESYKFCYFLGNLYEQESQRANFRPFLLKPPSGPKPQVLESFLDKKIKGLEEPQVKTLTQLVQELEKKSFSSN